MGCRGSLVGGCEPSIEVFLKMQNQKSRGGRCRVGGCDEPRIEVIVRMQKSRGGGGSDGWM